MSDPSEKPEVKKPDPPAVHVRYNQAASTYDVMIASTITIEESKLSEVRDQMTEAQRKLFDFLVDASKKKPNVWNDASSAPIKEGQAIVEG